MGKSTACRDMSTVFLAFARAIGIQFIGELWMEEDYLVVDMYLTEVGLELMLHIALFSILIVAKQAVNIALEYCYSE